MNDVYKGSSREKIALDVLEFDSNGSSRNTWRAAHLHFYIISASAARNSLRFRALPIRH